MDGPFDALGLRLFQITMTRERVLEAAGKRQGVPTTRMLRRSLEDPKTVEGNNVVVYPDER
jgi:hypothetical protein